MAAKLKTVSLSAALSDAAAVKVAVGCDIAGMLGRADHGVLAAAAALPNATTDSAEVVLPLALPCELAGTYLLGQMQQVAALIAAPAGVPSPASLIAALARAADVAEPHAAKAPQKLDRLSSPAPASPPAWQPPDKAVLLIGRQAMQSGSGAITSHCSWQRQMQPSPVLRLCPADAEAMNVDNYANVTVAVDGRSIGAAVQVSRELPSGVLVVSDAAQSRTLVASDTEGDLVAAMPPPVTVSA